MDKRTKPFLSRKEIQTIPLSDRCREVILGSLLGDGSLKIAKGYKNARLTIRHSIVQEEYLRWKAEELQEIASAGSIQLQKPDGFSANKKISFQSRALPQLTVIHRKAYESNQLRIKRSWLNHMTELSLLVWWLDDGSIIANGRKGVFCTESFDLNAHRILQRYLKVVWGISTTIGKHSSQSDEQKYRLYLNNSELRKLFLLIMPLFCVSNLRFELHGMLKKFCLQYNDPQFQQRWISEMKESMPTLDAEIDQWYFRE
uniref:Putative LAGLIDADG homing endonuclease n=1 Tax=Xylochloris irregularis TaxID=480381 RepID=A0A097KMG7_9CHLO|nr:putative LAGLIDADG homing endonuclease [Xylochloris irregularis]YP_009105669.1 putative LAGLIDADG homing endonuclease [Xylochloris irregularis]AIT94370.1 putative LAGLIDADG homing endonuclease [Xylochloris irregularis]AIT94372.1 putative LAGLIDADG homing endonuclease [Xylochloris irregularis]